MSFDYDTFTTRNFGFISASEQAKLRNGAVFVVGVGDLPPNFHPAIGRVSSKATPVGAM